MASSSSSPGPGPGGRSLRPLSCERSCLANADGSALFKAGATQVMASVHGPIAPRIPQHEDPDACQISVIVKSGGDSNNSQNSNTYEREWEHFLKNVLASAVLTESFPRSVVQVVLTVLSADGSVLAASLHAAVSALMDAGIPMKFLPTAVTCLVVHVVLPTTNKNTDDDINDTATTSSPSIQLDPTADQERSRGAGTVVLAVSPNDNTILASHTSRIVNGLSLDGLLECCELAIRAGPAVTAFWRLVVEQKVARESQTLWSSSR